MTGVAVSGGADSIYLLHYLLAAGESLTVLHVNHKLRGEESDEDERCVATLASTLNLPMLAHIARVPAGNVEQEARESRYRWFRSLIASGCVDRIALGHTHSDQAETVLFRFLRGAGTAGLAGIRPETTDGFFRPLLHLTRDEIRASLCARGLVWREDSSNSSLRHARNRIRHQLLPLLRAEWNPRVDAALVQAADWALAEEAYWAAEMDKLAAEHFRDAPPDLIIPWPAFLPLAARRRFVRHAVKRAKGSLRQVDFRHIEAILSMSGGKVALPGLVVERSFQWLRLGPGAKTSGFRHQVDGPGIYGPLELHLASPESVYNSGSNQLDWNRISGSLELRNWQVGDRYRRVGHTNEETLKLLFQKAKVPVWERRLWPVLVSAGRIAWSRQFGVAAEVARVSDTRTVLLIRELSGFSNRNL